MAPALQALSDDLASGREISSAPLDCLKHLVGALAYMFGAIPTGYWLGMVLKNIDIREHGSKSWSHD